MRNTNKTFSVSQFSPKTNLGGNRNKVSLGESENISAKLFQVLIFQKFYIFLI